MKQENTGDKYSPSVCFNSVVFLVFHYPSIYSHLHEHNNSDRKDTYLHYVHTWFPRYQPDKIPGHFEDFFQDHVRVRPVILS